MFHSCPRRPSPIKVLKGASSVLLIRIILELGARVAFWPRRVVERVAGLDDSTRRILWVKQHKRGEKLPYPYERYDALRGWAVISGLVNIRVGDGTVLNTNSPGIRGKEEFSENRKPGIERIAVLGDSFTFGNEVSDDETYPRYLETILPNSEVLNFEAIKYFLFDNNLISTSRFQAKEQPQIVRTTH